MKTLELTESANTASLQTNINTADVELIDIFTTRFWLHPAQIIEVHEEVKP